MNASNEQKDKVAALQEWQAREASQAICELVARGDFADFTILPTIAGALVDALAVINSRTATV